VLCVFCGIAVSEGGVLVLNEKRKEGSAVCALRVEREQWVFVFKMCMYVCLNV
jgi:hypothetical protein